MLSNLVNLRRTVSPANVNHYNVQPVYDVFANVQGRDLAAVAADVQKAIDAVRPELPRGSTIVMRGQVETMNSSFTGLAAGLGFAVLLVYLLQLDQKAFAARGSAKFFAVRRLGRREKPVPAHLRARTPGTLPPRSLSSLPCAAVSFRLPIHCATPLLTDSTCPTAGRSRPHIMPRRASSFM